MNHDRIGDDDDSPVAKEPRTFLECLSMISDVMEAPGEQNYVEGAIRQRGPLIYIRINKCRETSKSVPRRRALTLASRFVNLISVRFRICLLSRPVPQPTCKTSPENVGSTL